MFHSYMYIFASSLKIKVFIQFERCELPPNLFNLEGSSCLTKSNFKALGLFYLNAL